MPKNDKNTMDMLVTRSKKGDAEAFGLLYDQLVKPVYRYIYYRVDSQIAEDLTEETFLKAWHSLKRYKKGKHPFSSWVFKIAHNLVCDYYRKHRHNVELTDALADDSESRHPAFRINIKLEEIRLKKAIKQLPEMYQQVIILKYMNELDHSEIAMAVGKSEGAVRTIQTRALKKLKIILDNGETK